MLGFTDAVVGFRWLSLLRRGWVLDEVRLVDPAMHLVAFRVATFIDHVRDRPSGPIKSPLPGYCRLSCDSAFI